MKIGGGKALSMLLVGVLTSCALARPRPGHDEIEAIAKEAYEVLRQGDDVAAFQGFLDRGFPVNYHRGEGDTPLHWTARTGRPGVAKLLLERGGDPNAKSDILYTPLHWAASYGHTEIVRLLLEHNANPNVTGGVSAVTGAKHYETPLHCTAAKSGFYANKGVLECTRLLVEHGANVNAKNDVGATPLYIAIQYRKKNVAEFLLTQNPDVNTVQSREQRTPLIEAMGNNYFDIARELILRGADVNAQESYQGYTPLHYAVLLKQPDLVKLMVSKGADPDVKNKYGRTPLNEAQKLGDVEITQILLDAVSRK